MQPPILGALCSILAGHPEDVDWPAFSLADWDRLVTTARREGVTPLLYHTLQSAGLSAEACLRAARKQAQAGWPTNVPNHVRGELRSSYYTTTAQNLLIYHELSRILTALTHPPTNTPAHQPIILLKGAALAATVYPDIGLRPMGDLDLLVSRQHLEPAVQAVRSLGYREVYPEMTPGLNWPAGYHVHLRGGPHQSVNVELHWGLVAGDTDWRSPPLDWFWEQTERWTGNKGIREQGNREIRERGASSVSLPGRAESSRCDLFPYQLISFSAYQLTPTAHLLYLAAHLMLQHGGGAGRLLWFYDLHLLINRWGSRLDWDELLIRAREFRWSAALHAGLRETQGRFDTHLPEGFLDALADHQDPEAWRFVERKGGRVRTQVAGTWSELTAIDWPTRLRLAWRIACPSPTYVRWRYKPEPAWLWPLCYPYRWLVILRDSLSTLWRIGKGMREQGNKWNALV